MSVLHQIGPHPAPVVGCFGLEHVCDCSVVGRAGDVVDYYSDCYSYLPYKSFDWSTVGLLHVTDSVTVQADGVAEWTVSVYD